MADIIGFPKILPRRGAQRPCGIVEVNQGLNFSVVMDDGGRALVIMHTGEVDLPITDGRVSISEVAKNATVFSMSSLEDVLYIISQFMVASVALMGIPPEDITKDLARFVSRGYIERLNSLKQSYETEKKKNAS